MTCPVLAACTPRRFRAGLPDEEYKQVPDWAAWTGWIATFAFGVISVWQFIQYLKDRAARDANKKHLLAMKHSLQSLRQMCSEAIQVEEVIKTDPVRQWVRQVAWTLLGIEGHIDKLLEIEHAVKTADSK